MPDNDFKGRNVIITGGGSGMGAATAVEVAGREANVLIVDLQRENANAVAAEIGAQVMIGDVSDSKFCDTVVGQCVASFGRLDVVVNAAGVILRASGIETDDQAWERVMKVNVNGTFFMCRAALRAMKQNPADDFGRGAIVNFGSIWGDLGSAGVAAYCASKGAVHNLTRALALDHASDQIRVNAVCPGEVNTPMLNSQRSVPVTPELIAQIAATVPMGRLAEPAEIAKVVAFLASSSASYMTGAMVSVDAGYGAR